MSSLNDTIYNKLGTLGFTGSLNDRLTNYYADYLGVSPLGKSLPYLERQFLFDNLGGVRGGSNQDLWYEFLTGEGHTGSNADMKLAYWVGSVGASSVIWVLLGQSNMVGRATYDSLGGHPAGVKQIARSAANAEVGAALSGAADGALIAAANMLDHWDGVAGDMGMSIGFADAWTAANPGDTLIFVPAAHGGTSFFANEWDATPGNEYAEMVTRTNAALSATGATLGGFIVALGESDSNTAPAAFAAAAADMIGRMRSEITGAANAPVVWTGMPASYEASSAGRITVAAAIDDLIHTTPGVGVVETTDIPDPGTDGDVLHWDAAEVRTVGTRAHAAMLLALGRTDGAPTAPTDVAVTADGSASYVTWTEPSFMGGPVLRYYSIERREGAGAWSEVAQAPYGATAGFDTTAAPSTSYGYRVTAISDDYTGTPSAEVTLTTPAAATTLAVEAYDSAVDPDSQDVFGNYEFAGLAVATGAVVIAVTTRGSGTISADAVTINGHAATPLVNIPNGSSQTTRLFTARVAGTSADMSVAVTGTVLRLGAAIWSVGAADLSATTTASQVAAASGTTVTVDVTSQAGGLVLAHHTYIGSGKTNTWTSPLAERGAEEIIETTYVHATADAATAGAGAVTVTDTLSSAASQKVLAVAVVGP